MQGLPGYEKDIMAGRMHGLRMFPECENESGRRTMSKRQMVNGNVNDMRNKEYEVLDYKGKDGKKVQAIQLGMIRKSILNCLHFAGLRYSLDDLAYSMTLNEKGFYMKIGEEVVKVCYGDYIVYDGNAYLPWKKEDFENEFTEIEEA